MDIIKVMDSSLSNMIAAGEVVERPASVVKELIENAIDAKADNIEVSILGAGRNQIKVKDNGEGMSKNDARLAFFRHATSKIKTKQDLFSIKTMGFRGEAIPSIAAVSNVSLETSKGDVGTHIVVENDKILKEENVEARKGTLVEVTKLFYNTPARLKYLKSDNTELSNIIDVVNKQALANPGIRFVLNSEGKKVFSTSGRNDLLEVIKDVYGLDVAKNMVKLELVDNDYEVNGYVGKFILSKSTRNYMVFIVNGRNVKIPIIQNAVMEAYANYIPRGRFPMVVINIEVDPSLVDVNVHPSKNEIRLEKNDKLTRLIYEGIRNVLTNSHMIPYVDNVKKEVVKPEINLDSSFEYNFEEPRKETLDLKEETLTINEPIIEIKKEEKPSQNTIQMTPIGQIHETYIVAQSQDGFYLIDQHAAMERINFEKFSKSLMEVKDQIDLLVPVVVELSLNVTNSIKDKLELLEEVGIKAELFGNNALKISSIPTWMQDIDVSTYVQDIVEQVVNNKEINIYQLRNYAIATISCKASLKANKHLSIQEMEYVISRLLTCDNPHTCPHGRPTMLFYSKQELEKMFKRTM